jgi:hypothetical protein
VATSNGPGNADNQQPEGQPELWLAIEGLLRRLPPELVEAIRLGAIPHRFDAELLSLLRGSAAGTGSLLEEMRRLGLLRETASGWLTYHDRLRSHLLAGLQNQPAIYRQANAQAAEYFRTRLAREGNPNPESDLLEYLYHLLAADETTGLIQLRRSFDGFRRASEFGLAERLIDYAVEQQPALSQAGQDWLRYLGAQLRQAGPELEASQQTFREMATEAGDPLLRAAARRSLGETLARSQQWAAGINELQDALRAFQQIGDRPEIANTQATFGLVFVSLAEAAGGLRDEIPPLESPPERWFYHLEHAPFLVYRWFSRRFAFVPNLYLGTDYQNWIIVRYLYSAIRWFTRADRTLELVDARDGAAHSVARTHIGIRLADLRHRIGRWSQAEKRFAALEQDPTVRASPYLRGLVQLGQGRALVARGRLRHALENLRECRTIFRQYGDLNNAGTAARLVGQAHARLGEIEEAVHAYQAAAEAFYSTDDLLNATETLVRAQTLAERLPAGERDSVHTTELSERFPRQAYMERFPDRTSGSLHRFFRRFATFLELPLTGLLVILLTLVLVLWIGAVELLFSAVVESRTGLLLDLAAALPILLLMPLLATWAYEAIYAIGGVLVAQFLPVQWITRQQSHYFVLDQQSLGHYDRHGSLVDLIRWSEVTIAASLDRGIWRTPLTLFSRFLIGDEEKTLVVDGILNHYVQFKREVSKRLRTQPQPARILSLDFSLLDRRWFLVTLAVTVLILGILIIRYPDRVAIPGASPSDAPFLLRATGVVYHLWMLLIFIGPLFALIHWLQNRRAIRRSLGDRVQMGADWPIWLALLVILVSTVLQLVSLLSPPQVPKQ